MEFFSLFLTIVPSYFLYKMYFVTRDLIFYKDTRSNNLILTGVTIYWLSRKDEK